jgi:hypothetical protein
MSHIYDRDSFRKGVQDAGDTACRNAPAGYSRDAFQKSFREGVRSCQRRVKINPLLPLGF